jgi:predicted aldo/keto reductase-like oxidoreductase
MYNEAGFEKSSWYFNAALGTLKESEKPSACSSCGNCNPICPQGIDIPDALKKFDGLIN